jgi:hypothetical protein
LLIIAYIHHISIKIDFNARNITQYHSEENYASILHEPLSFPIRIAKKTTREIQGKIITNPNKDQWEFHSYLN